MRPRSASTIRRPTPPAPSASLCSPCASRARRYLHSFPTRRSSDLFFDPCTIANHVVGVLRHPHRGSRGRPHRSEEHTSELQSPCNLVCRLLLEKKKSVAPRRYVPRATSPQPRSPAQ